MWETLGNFLKATAHAPAPLLAAASRRTTESPLGYTVVRRQLVQAIHQTPMLPPWGSHESHGIGPQIVGTALDAWRLSVSLRAVVALNPSRKEGQ